MCSWSVSCRRTFRPDFVLVRQNLKDAGEDYKPFLLGLQYGGVPAINTLSAIYNFQVVTVTPSLLLTYSPVTTSPPLSHCLQDKPWVFAHLVSLQKKMGKENFPLIDQSFYPNHKEMVCYFFLPF